MFAAVARRVSFSNPKQIYLLFDMIRIFFSIAASLAIVALVPQSSAAEPRELGRVKVKSLREISGIAVSKQNPGIVWMHNDGDVKQIFAVESSGKVVAQLRAPRGIEDLEDIAIGPGPDPDRDYLYLGDIGDNDNQRRSVRVFRFLEPTLSGSGQEVAEQVKVSTLIYPDGPQDAEALLVDPSTGDVLIATKDDQRTSLYLAAAEAFAGQSGFLRKIAELDVVQVSSGDISRDGQLIALRSEDAGWLWERRDSESIEQALAREPRVIPVRGAKQGANGEAVAFSPDGDEYVTMSEGKNESLYSFPIPRTAP